MVMSAPRKKLYQLRLPLSHLLPAQRAVSRHSLADLLEKFAYFRLVRMAGFLTLKRHAGLFLKLGACTSTESVISRDVCMVVQSPLARPATKQADAPNFAESNWL